MIVGRDCRVRSNHLRGGHTKPVRWLVNRRYRVTGQQRKVFRDPISATNNKPIYCLV